MSKVCLLDAILEGYKATEIAIDCKCEDADAAAKTWFSEVYHNSEYRFGEKPTYSRYVCDIEAGWELYYDYGADYYFAVNYVLKDEDEEQ